MVRGPSGEVECRLNLTPTGGSGSFIPTEVGMHEVRRTLTSGRDRSGGGGCPAAATPLATVSDRRVSGRNAESF